ncbi:MAG: cytochrome P450 [Pseudomonadota bacterium]
MSPDLRQQTPDKPVPDLPIPDVNPPEPIAPQQPVAIRPPRRALSAWGAWRAARANVLALVPEAAYRAPFLRGKNLGGRWSMAMAPELVERVLHRNEANYPRSDITLRMLRPTEGANLFTADGPDWRWQRRAMVPAFHGRSLAGLAPMMTAAAETAATRLIAEAEREGMADVYPAMVLTACDVIAETMLSGGGGLDRSGLLEAIDGYIDTVGRLSLLDVLGLPAAIPRPARLIDRYGPAMDRLIDRVVARRREEGPRTTPDLLDHLIAAHDPESGRAMDRIALRNNLLIMLVAGHETTALALTWALYLLAFHPDAQVKAREEAQSVLGTRAAEAGDLARLPFCRQVLDEALRLYPPAGFLSRQAREADTLGGHTIAARETVIVPVYAIQRHRLLWDEPDAFAPERFAPGQSAHHRYAYLPFGAGPRICIGMGFALMEAQIVLATLLARLSFALVPETRPVPEMVLTLRPRGGMTLGLTRL